VLNRPNYHSRRICLKGLQPDRNYQIEGDKGVYHGDTLMHAGINIPNMWGDFQSVLIHVKAAE
jgi:alpha-galactosidase